MSSYEQAWKGAEQDSCREGHLKNLSLSSSLRALVALLRTLSLRLGLVAFPFGEFGDLC